MLCWLVYFYLIVYTLRMIPVYQSIINTIVQRIETGQYAPEQKIPSESQLMTEFGTSRITVTRALKELEYKKYIYRHKGKGSFVSPPQQSRSSIISLVIPHTLNFFSGGQQYSRTIYENCQHNGYLCSVHYSDQSTKKEKRILEDILHYDVAGLILYPIGSQNVDTISKLILKKLPIVLLDRDIEEVDMPVVQSDNFYGAHTAVQHLISAGHRNIAFIGKKDSITVTQRYRGYCKALLDNGIPINKDFTITHYRPTERDDIQEIMTEKEAMAILEYIRALKPAVTAAFCVNDLVAFRIIEAARLKNINIPKDISIIGFDNLHYLTEKQLRLSTVAQDFETIGKVSVDLILDQINTYSPTPEKITIPTRLIKGNSVTPPFA